MRNTRWWRIRRRLVAGAVVVGTVVATPAAPAGPARDSPRVLHCHAWGTAVFDEFGGFGANLAWQEIRATGTCTGDPAGLLNVIATGSGAWFEEDLPPHGDFAIDVLLSDAAGNQRVTLQAWRQLSFGLGHFVVHRRGTPVGGNLPLGEGKGTFGTVDPPLGPTVVPVSLNWRFTSPAWS